MVRRLDQDGLFPIPTRMGQCMGELPAYLVAISSARAGLETCRSARAPRAGEDAGSVLDPWQVLVGYPGAEFMAGDVGHVVVGPDAVGGDAEGAEAGYREGRSADEAHAQRGDGQSL